jgi:hypothetical protein
MITLVVLLLGSIFQLIVGPDKPPKPPKPLRPPRTPQELHILWVCLATGALAALAYLPFLAAAVFQQSPVDVVGEFVIEFVHTPLDPPAVLVGWAAVVVIAVVYLRVGLRGAAEGPHAGLWAFWSAALPIVAGTVLALHAPALLGNAWVRGVCLVVAVTCAMRCYLAMRGSTAERTVRRNMRRKYAPLRPGRRRRFLFF